MITNYGFQPYSAKFYYLQVLVFAQPFLIYSFIYIRFSGCQTFLILQITNCFASYFLKGLVS